MIHFGSPESWVNFIETQIPDILTLVIDTWQQMPSPAANELEDPVSEGLCRSLRRARNRCDFPFSESILSWSNSTRLPDKIKDVWT